jgi:hypothetical protein
LKISEALSCCAIGNKDESVEITFMRLSIPSCFQLTGRFGSSYWFRQFHSFSAQRLIGSNVTDTNELCPAEWLGRF